MQWLAEEGYLMSSALAKECSSRGRWTRRIRREPGSRFGRTMCQRLFRLVLLNRSCGAQSATSEKSESLSRWHALIVRRQNGSDKRELDATPSR